MNINNTIKNKAIITIPSEFYENIFGLVDDADFLINIFSGDVSAANNFKTTLNMNIKNFTNDIFCDEWAIVKETNHNAFFLHPKDNSRAYKINCNQPTVSKYYKFKDGYACDSDGFIVVDNKMFGLIITLAALDSYGNSDNPELIAIYVDNAYFLSDSIHAASESFTMKPSLDIDRFNKEMSLMRRYHGLDDCLSDYY